MTIQNVVDLGELNAPVLIFGGPYGNLQATIAMQEKAEELSIPPSHVFCNGDTVAYCAQPEETVALLRKWSPWVIVGNCEESLATGRQDCGCGFKSGTSCSLLAESWYGFCQERLSENAKVWMGTLPRTIQLKLGGLQIRLVHGAVSCINRFLFASSPMIEKQKELELTDVDVVIGGHAGIPFGQKLPNQHYWLNSGVIGMPANDGSRDGWYLLLTPMLENLRCEWYRLNYDALGARNALYQAGLRNGYADALISGLWPSMDVLPEQERNLRGRPIEAWSMLLENPCYD